MKKGWFPKKLKKAIYFDRGKGKNTLRNRKINKGWFRP